MQIEPTAIADVLLIKPRVFRDERGHFLETFRACRYAEAGIDVAFVQDNFSRSTRGILRGLHYQLNHPQGKLVNVIRGEVYDVAVDLRVDSPTFGKWVGAYLSEENNHQLYIPPGFAHGFCVVSDVADFMYKCSDTYHPEDEHVIAWNDAQLNINWPIDTPILSDRDRIAQPFSDATYYEHTLAK